MDTFWRKQEKSKPLFPDIEWNKSEQRDRAGRLGIIGGSILSFVAAADSYQTATKAGVSKVRVLLPDALKKNVPPHMTDVFFAPTNPSGSLANTAEAKINALDRFRVDDIQAFVEDHFVGSHIYIGSQDSIIVS